MAKVEIAEDLKKEIFRKFKGESHRVLNLIHSLKENPHKGKLLGNVGGIVIKELKYRNFRLYFVTNGYQLRVLGAEKLKDLLIKFVRMSDKKAQQKTIEEIKIILRKFGSEGL